MPRVLDPAQIEAGLQRTIPRIGVPRPDLYSRRAARLREFAAGHGLQDYLRLMAVLCDAQQDALARLAASSGAAAPASADLLMRERVRLAREHGMPLLPAGELPLDPRWRAVLAELCTTVAEAEGFPAVVAETCRRIRALSVQSLDAQARLLLQDAQGAGAGDDIDVQAAPLLMAALQCWWTHAVSGIDVIELRAHAERFDVPGICPVCASLPVASIVRADPAHDGYRYLQCSLCATEWHLVRIKCSQCGSTEGIHYHSLVDSPAGSPPGSPGGDVAAGGAQAAVRAEACGNCHSYRKICYQAQDPGVEPLADDLASIALDLLMNEAGFERASGHPLLWQAG